MHWCNNSTIRCMYSFSIDSNSFQPRQNIRSDLIIVQTYYNTKGCVTFVAKKTQNKDGAKMTILRAGLYERVSTDEQVHFGFSIQTQIDALSEYCQKNKIKVVDHYTEEGISGGKSATKRPEMARLLADVEAGKIDIILFTKLDRWFRNVKEYFKVQEILDKHKVEWKAIHEDYDTTTANGRMAITIFLAIAQNEREKTSERIKVVFENKWKNKEALFGDHNTPFGYVVQKDENGLARLVKDPNTREAMEAFFEIVLKYNNVAKAMRYVGQTYGIWRDRKRWQETVHNEIYTGTYRGVKDYCEPYITFEEFELIRDRPSYKQTQNNRVYLFTGMFICPNCGRRMSSAHTTKNHPDGTKTEYYHYRCQTRFGGQCSGTKTMSELRTENWLLANIDNLIKNEIATVEIEKAKPKPKPKTNIPALKEQLRRLEVVYMAGNKTDAEYIAETNEIKDKIKKAEIERLMHEDTRDTSNLQHLLATDFRGIYATLDREDKRRFWRSIIKEIHHKDGRPISVDFLYS